MMVKTLALSTVHKSLGAKMMPFAGYDMPIRYEGVKAEHFAVRDGVGVFDVSHMGEFFIYGKNALSLIQNVTTNDASQLTIGKAQYSCMTNAKGGIVDDLIVYRLGTHRYMLVVNASNIEKDWDWICSQNTVNAEMENVSDKYALLAVQGPKALDVMQSLTPVELKKIPFYHFEMGVFSDIEDIIISATGYTGSGGFEIYCKNDDVQKIWEALFDAGKPYAIKPIGLAARDTLRLEMGYCLYGNDIDESTSPIEGGLGWITKFDKDFIAKDILENQKACGVSRNLVGFEMEERGIPRKGYDILDEKINVIGSVTSGTMSPSLGKGIGMGYVQVPNCKTGKRVLIKIRDKQIPAKIVKPPFYKKVL